MTPTHLHVATDADDPPPAGAKSGTPWLSELSLEFVPLAMVAEWSRCSEAADYVARFFAHDYGDRELAANVLSTVVNELLENAVKFSSDKTVPARLTMREFPEHLTITTTNRVTAAQGAAFARTVARIVHGDAERMFAEQVANPPGTGGAGIGLIMLRKDYGARIAVRVTPVPGEAEAAQLQVQVTIDNGEIEPR